MNRITLLSKDVQRAYDKAIWFIDLYKNIRKDLEGCSFVIKESDFDKKDDVISSITNGNVVNFNPLGLVK